MFLALLAAALILRLHDVGTVRVPGPDAFHYARQAQIVLDRGTAGLRAEADRFRTDAAMWGVPPPWRAGFLYIAAGWMKLTDMNGVGAVAYLAAWTDAFALLLLGLLAWRHFGPWTAIAAMALYGFSPPMLQMARHGWEEPLLSLIGLAMLMFAARAVENAAGWWWPAALGLTAGLALTLKELALVDGALVCAFAAIALWRAKAWGSLGLLAGGLLAGLGFTAAWITYITGGVAQTVPLFASNFRAAAEIPYSVAYESGSAWTWLLLIWRGDPALVLAGGFGIGALFANRRRQPLLLWWGAGVALVLLVLPLTGSHLLNLRFTSAAIGPLCLIAAVAITRVAVPRWFAVCVIAAVTQFNIHLYRSTFEKPDLQDLSAGMLVTKPVTR